MMLKDGEKEKLRLKTGKEDWAVFLNGEAALGQLSYGSATL
jgi:hypothetical protein